MPSEAMRDPLRLLADARQGKRDALGTLLEMYRNYLYLFARIQADQQLAARLSPSDLIQDTYVRAFRSFNQFRGATEQELLAWLRRILVNAMATAIERQLQAGKRDARRERPIDACLRNLEQSSQQYDAALVSQWSSPSAQAEQRESAANVADQLAKLPAQYRDVIVLRNLESLPFEEVARRMGRSVGAVRVLWVRALARLRQMQAPEDAS